MHSTYRYCMTRCKKKPGAFSVEMHFIVNIFYANWFVSQMFLGADCNIQTDVCFKCQW